jgi:UDP-glucose 4-epimerase
VFVEDVARANVLALSRGDNDIFCIGSGTPTSVNEIYEVLANLTGYKPEITRAPKRQGDIYLSYFNSSKAERLLGWKPSVTFAEGVKTTVEYFKSRG